MAQLLELWPLHRQLGVPAANPGAPAPVAKPQAPVEVAPSKQLTSEEALAKKTIESIINNDPVAYAQTRSPEDLERIYKGRPVTISKDSRDIYGACKGFNMSFSTRPYVPTNGITPDGFERSVVQVTFTDRNNQEVKCVESDSDRNKKSNMIEVTVRKDKQTGKLYGDGGSVPK